MANPEPLEPINWDSVIKAEGTGPRHYGGAEVNTKHPWKCPACSAENVGPLGQGCSSCGSGGGAKHVGVDPIVRKADPDQVQSTSTVRTVPAVSDSLTRAIPQVVNGASVAFSRWVREFDTHTFSDQQFDLLGAAFTAGWYAVQTIMTNDPPLQLVEGVLRPVPFAGESMSSSETTETLPGTPRSRTILAALIVFKEQVLLNQPEEIATGEWLTVKELDYLIAELQKEQTS